ncbi:MAG: hypothetical protein IIA07_06850 [Proteobacteria bacterium]|nr:hypothetical protein [Pseudomonadota bacterium]
MTALDTIFGNTPAEAEDSESDKLLNLYKSRQELKKEFADLGDEQYRLKEFINEQEGVMARLQQKFDHLENLLFDPEWVNNIVTYYQLRGLNFRCEVKLAKFAEQLKQQREKKQHSQLLADWNELRRQEALGLESEIGEQRMQVQILEDQLQVERHRYTTMSGFLKIFRRHSATAILNSLEVTLELEQQNESDLLQRYDEVQNHEPPDTQGLNIATKRMINFIILAFAQQIYLHFEKDNVANMAKEAGEKSAGTINYGGKASCDEIVASVQKRIEALDSATDIAEVLQLRAKLIAEEAQFRTDDDAVPVAASVGTIYAIEASGAVKKSDAHLLGENYWNISNILSR